MWRRRLDGAANRVEGDQHNHGADHGNHEAVEIEAADAGFAEALHDPAADDRADDAEYEVADQPLARLVHDLARDEARDDSQDQPSENAHSVFPLARSRIRAARG